MCEKTCFHISIELDSLRYKPAFYNAVPLCHFLHAFYPIMRKICSPQWAAK